MSSLFSLVNAMELGELEDSNNGEDFPQPFSTDPLGLNRVRYELSIEYG